MLNFEKIKAVLEREGLAWIAQIQANMIAEGVNASGRTSDSLQVNTIKTVDGINFQITGDEAFNWIEQGRGATIAGGNGDVLPRIKQWIQDKGIDYSDDKELNSLAYAITNTIHASGTLAYRLGERREIYTPVFTDLEIERVMDLVSAEIEESIETTVIKHWKL